MLGFYLWESFIFHFLRNHSYAPAVVRLWYFSAAFAHPFSVLLPRTFVCASFSTCLLALLLFCPPNQLSSLRVEMLNESLSNTCVQLRSYRAFKISVSWRREGENRAEAIWASRRYFGVCWMWANERPLGIEFSCDWEALGLAL